MKIDVLSRNTFLSTVLFNSIREIALGNYAGVLSVFDSEENCANTRARFQSARTGVYILVYQAQCPIGKIVGDGDVHANLANPMKLGRVVQ